LTFSWFTAKFFLHCGGILKRLDLCITCYGNPRNPHRHPKERLGLTLYINCILAEIIRENAYDQGRGMPIIHLLGCRTSGLGPRECEGWKEELEWQLPRNVLERIKLVTPEGIYGGAGIAQYCANLLTTNKDCELILHCDEARAMKMAHLISVALNKPSWDEHRVYRECIIALSRHDQAFASTDEEIGQEYNRVKRGITTPDELAQAVERERIEYGPAT
jgi:hypothetical protein